MNIILLSGGSGKRLWPLSNDIRSKQFIKFFKKENGETESMIQRIYRQIKSADSSAVITIATSKSQLSSIYNQLGDNVDVSAEPCRRDTFPAIALAAAYLHDKKGISDDTAVIICPVDPYVNEEYFAFLKKLEMQVNTGMSNLTLMGITPTYPSEKYGYIIPQTRDDISLVKTFKEKPDIHDAKKYINMGALWNGGIFACKLGYLLKKVQELTGYNSYYELFNNYSELPKISFDYAVVEKEKKIAVLRFSGQWKDIGTWNTLTESMPNVSIGHSVMNDKCTNVHIINELNIPIVAMGLNDVVISASHDGILVSDKEQSSYIKPYVDKIEQRTMFAEKSWGSFKIINVEDDSLTIKVTLNAGHKMNYHSHQKRDEIWNVISGNGIAVIDGEKTDLYQGDVIKIKKNTKHTIIAKTNLKLVEIQIGNEITVHDKQKFELDDNSNNV